MSTEKQPVPARAVPPTVPPTAAQLLAALDRLPAGTPRRVALLHLATPAAVVGGMGVEFAGGRYAYRDYVRASHGDDAATIAADVLAVVHAGHRPGDTYLDLDGDPAGWVKVLRSGFRHVAFGTDALFGAPLVAVDADASPEVAAALAAQVVRAWQSGELADGAALAVPGARAVAAVGADVVTLALAGAAEPDLPEPWTDRRGAAVHAATVGTSLATLLVAEEMALRATGSRFPGAEDFEVTLRLAGGWSAVVPVTVAPGAELIGVDTEQVLAAPEQPLPDGFVWCGRSLWADAAVGWHVTTEIAALLRREPVSA